VGSIIVDPNLAACDVIADIAWEASGWSRLDAVRDPDFFCHRMATPGAG
jgi:hypothetical protein